MSYPPAWPSVQSPAARSVVLGEPLPVGRLWTAFVLGWLSVLVVSAGLVWKLVALSRLLPVLLGFGVLGALYLWLTLRVALTSADLALEGPPHALLRRRLALLGCMLAVILALVWWLPEGGVWWLSQHVIIAAGLALPARWAVPTSAVVLATSLATSWLAIGRIDPMLVIQAAFGAAAIAIRQLTITVAQLGAAREELADLAVARERLRFGRDLHDLLGHSLSLIVLKSELAGRLLPAAPEQAAREIGDVERAAREALREVRATVAGYRQPGLASELSAARDLLAAAGIQANIEQAVDALPAALDALLAWSVREGVTNVIRHSRARCCTIRVERAGDLARVEISDDGRGAAEGASAGGSGLAGLAERAAAQQGTLHYGAGPQGGFRLAVEAAGAALSARGGAA